MSDTPSTGSRASSHAKHPSRRQALLRQSTAGPLGDGDDPLTARSSSTSSPRTSSIPDRTRSSTPSRSSPARTPQLSAADKPGKSFAFLLRPEIYHVLSYDDLPAPFREAAKEQQDTSLEELLETGRFFSAAILAAKQLQNEPNFTDHARIFSLLFARLACLQILGLHDLAAQESRALQDLDSDFYHDQENDTHLIPWALRVLAVRLQAHGFEDWRRGVMSYYELAREARIAARKATAPEDRELWKTRLEELGIQVANALVEMGDVQAALRHLHSLPVNNGRQNSTLMRVVLLYLRLGDIGAAGECLAAATEDSETVKGILNALVEMSDERYDKAVESWTKLRKEKASEIGGADVVIRENLAVCLLYAGKAVEARKLLEDVPAEADAARISSFNLATVFELCSDQAVLLKQNLAKQSAERRPISMGWEKLNSDFKL